MPACPMHRCRLRFPPLLLLVGCAWLVALLLAAAPAGAASVALKISGLQGKMLANVQATVELPPGVVNDGVVERHWLERHVEKIPQLVDEALRPFGYYRSQTRCELQGKENGSYVVLVRVETGEPLRVTRAEVAVTGAGAGETALAGLVAAFPLRLGAIPDQGAYEAAKTALKAKALDLGYLDAAFSKHALTIDPAKGSCEVELVLETGPRYRFGAVTMSGAPDYPAEKLQRYVSFKPGEVFSHAELGETQLNLLNSDAFKEVVVTPRKEAAVDQAVPISVQLTPNARHLLRPGVGYSTDSGFRVSLRYLNRNAFDEGHHFNADLDLAETKQSLGATYTIPDRANLDSETQLKIGYEREAPETYETRTAYTEIERLKGFSEGRIGSVYLRLQQEDSDFGSEQEHARLVLPGLRWKEVHFDDVQRPREGFAARLEVRGTHQNLGSDTSLLQLLWGGNLLLPLPGPFTLQSRTDGGSTWQADPFGEVPASLRFFAGGDNSVRGYGYETLGPVDAEGEVIGGRNLLTLGNDLECAIGEEWGVAAFYDIGNAFDSWLDIDWKQSAGLGLRRYTVVGPVRLDFARQLNEVDPAWRVHVSIGFSW